MTAAARALHVGVDARSLLQRHPRGEGKTLLQLYAHLLRRHPDVRVTFFGDEHAAAACLPLPAGVACSTMSLPGHRFNVWENVCLPWLVWRAGCDVLHCASSGGPWWSPVPSVLTVHDLIPIVADDGMNASLQRAFETRLCNGLRHARRVIAVSEHTRRDLLRVVPDIRVPVDVIHWAADRADAALRPPEPPDGSQPYVLAFGGEAPRKNTAYLLDRFVAAAQRVPALRLVVVGVSGEREQLRIRQRIADAGLSERLELPGFVTDDALDALVRGASALLYLSTYEGFGMPLLEAIACGCPVIASDRSSIPEILNGVVGCFALANPAAIEDAIVDLVRDAAKRSAWLAAQRRVLSRFDWAVTADKTLFCLAGAAARRGVQPEAKRAVSE